MVKRPLCPSILLVSIHTFMLPSRLQFTRGFILKFFALFFVFFYTYAEAIITVEPIEIGAKPGVSGKIGGSFQTKRGNTNKDEYAGAIQFQYDNNESYTIWSNVTFSYGEVAGIRNTNKTFIHLRAIHRLSKKIDWETYVQSSTNEFTKVEKRRLGGAGLRLHLKTKKIGDLFLGLGAYYEAIGYTTDVDPYEHNTRVNSYIAYTKEFSETTKFVYTGYYQPNVNDMSDYITSNSISLKIQIYKKLYLNFILYYDVDSKPAVGVEKTDFTQVTSFTYEFE